MTAWLRRSLYASFGALWVTGVVWLLLHFLAQRETDFGIEPHPLQPKLLAIHGFVALAAVFLFGWVAGSHVGSHWPRRLKRVSGILLITAIAVLALTGIANYYLVESALRAQSSALHEIIGTIGIAPALVHWLGRKTAADR